MDHNLNPFQNWAKIVDCGDIENTPFDKLVAIHQLEKGMQAINDRKPANISASDTVRLITIGGDHTISQSSSLFENYLLTILQPFLFSVRYIPRGEELLSFTSTAISTHGIQSSLEVVLPNTPKSTTARCCTLPTRKDCCLITATCISDPAAPYLMNTMT